jgi:hypothetical protein
MPVNRGSKIRVWKNSSLSNPDVTYETIRWENGDFTCNCRGWILPKNGNPRTCRHVRSAESAFGLIQKQTKNNRTGYKVHSTNDQFAIDRVVASRYEDPTFPKTSEIADKISPKKYYRMIRVAE